MDIRFWGEENSRSGKISHQVSTVMDGFSIVDVFDSGNYKGLWIRQTMPEYGAGRGPFLYVLGRFNGIESNHIVRHKRE